jgi:ATP-dependent Clp protease ATP-binding subunit ClpC
LGWAQEALQRSFGRYPRTEDRASFEKFTGPARKVVVIAQEEARGFNHNYIGTEHLLLGLIREEEGIAAGALKELRVDLDEAREQVESIVGYGEEALNPHLPFTPRTNKVLQLAERESLQLDHDYISTEHVLLGLVRESEGVAARVLLNFPRRAGNSLLWTKSSARWNRGNTGLYFADAWMASGRRRRRSGS